MSLREDLAVMDHYDRQGLLKEHLTGALPNTARRYDPLEMPTDDTVGMRPGYDRIIARGD